MNKLYWNQVEYNKINLYFTCTKNGITFVNDPNSGISNVYHFYPDLDAEFCFDKSVTGVYKEQLEQFLNSTRRSFTLQTDIISLEFSDIYQAIQKIEYGTTMNFKTFCKQYSFDETTVKDAIVKNPLIMIIPTHRVLGVDYSNGYRKLADFNQLLLNIEKG